MKRFGRRLLPTLGLLALGGCAAEHFPTSPQAVTPTQLRESIQASWSVIKTDTRDALNAEQMSDAYMRGILDIEGVIDPRVDALTDPVHPTKPTDVQRDIYLFVGSLRLDRAWRDKLGLDLVDLPTAKPHPIKEVVLVK